jgi:Zn-finger nucleic acid-binding protein
MKRFFKEYAIELVAGGFILFGIFLMVERFEIRSTFLTALTGLFSGILSILNRILSRISSRAAVLTVTDALGILLILLAVVFIIWRIRRRFHTDRRWEIDACPKCSGPIMRVHRNWLDRVLGVTFLPEARRYRCMDPQCGWSGLLRRHIHHRRRRSEQVSRTENT